MSLSEILEHVKGALGQLQCIHDYGDRDTVAYYESVIATAERAENLLHEVVDRARTDFMMVGQALATIESMQKTRREASEQRAVLITAQLIEQARAATKH